MGRGSLGDTWSNQSPFWPTPAAQEPGRKLDGDVQVVDKNGNPPRHPQQRFYDAKNGRIVQKGLSQVVQMFPTPTTMDTLPPKSAAALHREATITRPGRKQPANLRDAVGKNGQNWPTESATDHKGAGQTGTTRDRLDYATERGQTKTKTYATPTAGEATGSKRAPNKQGGASLRHQIATQYATPQSRDFRSGAASRWENKERSRNLNDQIAAHRGGDTPARLNPDWVEWLMGWPIGWTNHDPLPAAAFADWLTQTAAGTWWHHDPANSNTVPRVVTKSPPRRAARLKALGNGQVPLTAFMAFHLLAAAANGQVPLTAFLAYELLAPTVRGVPTGCRTPREEGTAV